MTAACAYLRISQDRTGERAGITRQREDIERRCRERGWDLVAVHEDNDKSAKGGRKRPGFDAMLKAVDSGEAQVVVAWSLDRLQRNRSDEVRLYELCKARGATISLVNGADLDFSTAGGRLVADQLSSVARYEIELKSDRQRAAQLQAAKAGLRVGGRRPFGYTPDGMSLNDDEAKAIEEGYRAILGQNPDGREASVADIARMWNERGFTTGQGHPFTRSSVRDVLLNPRNCGLRSHVTVDDRAAARGARVDRTKHIITTTRAQWPAIVDEATWRTTVAKLHDPSRRTGGGTFAVSLLTGIATCGQCGETVHSGGASKPQADRGWRTYRCRSMKHVSRAAQPVEEFISALVIERLSRPDAVALLSDRSRQDVSKLREEAVALRTRLATFATDWADGIMTRDQFRIATERARARLADVEARMADAGRVDVLGPLVGASDVAAVWEALDVHRRRAVVDLLMRITLHAPGRGARTFRPETVSIEWKTT